MLMPCALHGDNTMNCSPLCPVVFVAGPETPVEEPEPEPVPVEEHVPMPSPDDPPDVPEELRGATLPDVVEVVEVKAGAVDAADGTTAADRSDWTNLDGDKTNNTPR